MAKQKKNEVTVEEKVTEIPSDRKDAFLKAIKEVSSKFKDDPITLLSDRHDDDVETISTGSLSLDTITGGGFPKGRIIEMYGPEGSGKTSIALTALAEVQRQGGYGVFIDAEQTFDPNYAQKLGVDLKKVGITQTNVVEEVLTYVINLAETGVVDMIIVDSVAAMVSLKEMSKELDQVTVAEVPRVMSKALPKIVKVANKNKCTVIFLNQIREKVGVMFGSPETTPGGRALKFNASQRIEVRRVAIIEEDKEKIGTEVKLKCVKNKTSMPYGETKTVLTFSNGIDRYAEVVKVAEDLNIVELTGRTFRYKPQEKLIFTKTANAVYEDDETIKIATSRKDFINELKNNEVLFNALTKEIVQQIKKQVMFEKE